MVRWPPEVREYAMRLCWKRQQEMQGGPVSSGDSWLDGSDGDVIEWMYRGRKGVRAMARARDIWPKLVAEARAWKERNA